MSVVLPLLSVRNLSKSFGGLRVVHDLSFDVAEGASTALIGPNGAGKTTVFNLISGVYEATSGWVMLGDRDITKIPSRLRISSGIARSFQNIRLIPRLTVVDNLLVGQHASLRHPMDILRPFRLVRSHQWVRSAVAELEAFGLAHYANEPVGSLPYGVRKRVDLIRATLAAPSILMLDEPAAGLNGPETDALRRHLDVLRLRGMTLLIIEHDMHFVKSACERVVVLNFGRKIAEGSFGEIRTDAHVREAYLGTEEAA